MATDLEFFTDPSTFLDVAGDFLAERPVVSTVVASTAERAAREQLGAVQRAKHPLWFLVARDAHGQLAGVGMRAASFAPYPLFVLPMPEAAAVELGQVLVARGEDVRGVNGALPAALVCATEMARLTGRVVEVTQQTRLFELGELVEPPVPDGHLKPADPGDLALVAAWFDAATLDADEQADRVRGSNAHDSPHPEDLRGRIDAGRIWFWVDSDGELVSMIGANAPAFGVARVGPVFTPKAYRGRGYASACVAQISREIVQRGSRACLFTDLANPTSNKIYRALGYHAVGDMVELTLAGS